MCYIYYTCITCIYWYSIYSTVVLCILCILCYVNVLYDRYNTNTIIHGFGDCARTPGPPDTKTKRMTTALRYLTRTVGRTVVEVWTTPCVVTAAPPSPLGATAARRTHAALVVPANSDLIGTAQPYFPMPPGSPVTDQPTSTWGGGSIGQSAFYPVQVVDGVVTQLGGKELRRLCADMPRTSPAGERCPTGSAVITTAPASLADPYGWEYLVHACPPLWQGPKDAALLDSTYASALSVGASVAQSLTFPLLGCGARQAPVAVSISAAAKSVSAFAAVDRDNGEMVIQFVLREVHLAEQLAEARS